MIIYAFSTWGDINKLFTITEIEVEEKSKTYIGKHTRINKSEINVLSSSYGNRMYRLDNNPAPYIEAIIKRKIENIERAEKRIINNKKELVKWLEARGESNEG